MIIVQARWPAWKTQRFCEARGQNKESSGSWGSGSGSGVGKWRCEIGLVWCCSSLLAGAAFSSLLLGEAALSTRLFRWWFLIIMIMIVTEKMKERVPQREREKTAPPRGREERQQQKEQPHHQNEGPHKKKERKQHHTNEGWDNSITQGSTTQMERGKKAAPPKNKWETTTVLPLPPPLGGCCSVLSSSWVVELESIGGFSAVFRELGGVIRVLALLRCWAVQQSLCWRFTRDSSLQFGRDAVLSLFSERKDLWVKVRLRLPLNHEPRADQSSLASTRWRARRMHGVWELHAHSFVHNRCRPQFTCSRREERSMSPAPRISASHEQSFNVFAHLYRCDFFNIVAASFSSSSMSVAGGRVSLSVWRLR